MRRLFILMTIMFAVLFSSCAMDKREKNVQTGSENAETIRFGTYGIDENLNPFTSLVSAGVSAAQLIYEPLVDVSRDGGLLCSAGEGEYRAYRDSEYFYEGIASIEQIYSEQTDETAIVIHLRNNIRFSDGAELDADDLLFTMYVLCDPSCSVYSEFANLPIVGLEEYRDAFYSEAFLNNRELAQSALANGDVIPDGMTAVQWDWLFETALPLAWTAQCKAISNYALENYADNADLIDTTEEMLYCSEAHRIAFAMVLWGYANYSNGSLTGVVTGEQWSLTETTAESFYRETYAAYAGDAEAFFRSESVGTEPFSVTDRAAIHFASYWYDGESMSICGIRKVDSHTVEIIFEGKGPSDYSDLALYIAPLHLYGDESMFDAEQGRFGFLYGNVSEILDKENVVGYGPYAVESATGSCIVLSPNPHYYLGAPQYSVAIYDLPQEEWMQEGLLDIVLSPIRLEAEDWTVRECDSFVYGFVGINAGQVCVNNDPGSEESAALRTGLLTAFSPFRSLVLTQYMPDAWVVNLPISSFTMTGGMSFVPFGVTLDGVPLPDAMSGFETAFNSTVEAVRSFLGIAGYKFDESGRAISAPGASLRYEMLLPINGNAAFESLSSYAAEVLEQVGIELVISYVDVERFYAELDAGSHQPWCASWSDGGFFSGMLNDSTGDSLYMNLYGIFSDDLALWLNRFAEAQDTDTQIECAEQIILHWFDLAVELPVYSRYDYLYFSERIDADSIPKDITGYWNWLDAIRYVRLK